MCWRKVTGKYAVLFLALCFVSVYLLPLIVNAPDLSNESLYQLAHSEQIQNTGFITPAPLLGYFDFPGIHLLGAELSQVIGLNLISTARVLVALDLLVLCVITYQLFTINKERNIPSGYLLLGLILAFEGNLYLPLIMTMFHSDALGLLFCLLFLTLFIRSTKEPKTWPLCVIVLLASIITNFVTSLFCVAIAVVSFCLMLLFRQRQPLKHVRNISFIAILTFSIWTIWQGLSNFTTGIRTVMSYQLNFQYLFNLLKANTGLSSDVVPPWVGGVRLFWLFFLCIIGGFVMFLAFFSKAKKKTIVELSGFLGLILLTIFLTIFSFGNSEIYRYMFYGTFFTIPFIICFFLDHPKIKKGLTVIAIVSLLLIFPTYVAQNTSVMGFAYHPSVIAGPQFLANSFSHNTTMLTIFGDRNVEVLFPYFYPYSTLIVLPSATGSNMTSVDGVADATNSLYQKFVNNTLPGNIDLFINSFQMTEYFQHLLQIESNNTIWVNLQENLEENNLIYNNQFVQYYVHSNTYYFQV